MMRNWWVVGVILLLLDLYIFTAVRSLAQHSSDRSRLIIYSSFWLVSVVAFLTVVLFPYMQGLHVSRFMRNYLFAIIVGLFLAKVIAATFFLIDDIRRLLQWVFVKLVPGRSSDGAAIPRSQFLSWLGIALGGSMFGTLIYGFSNKYNYHVKTIPLKFPNLPAGFQGLRIVQISDIHSGSFQNKRAVERGVELAMAQHPDLILFTGDLVNDRSEEMWDYVDVFSRLKAPMGVYSTLGNHDYGDYINWPSAEAKSANLRMLKEIQEKLGWRLLMNEHVALTRAGDQIALIGIENWSAKGRFPKYGRMDLAWPGAEQYPFKILMSHDPSHWDAEVRPKYPSIDLMLSGHTHGMQFGVELPHFKWSPVEYVYKQWAGLYQEGGQYLYVNRGYGFIGYPGRVGILPEITVIELS